LTVIGVFHCKLIDCTKNIILRFFKVNQPDHSRKAGLRYKLDPVDHPTVYLMKRGEIAFRTDKANGVHDLPNFINCQIWIGFSQELLQVICIQNLSLGIVRNAGSREIRPALSL